MGRQRQRKLFIVVAVGPRDMVCLHCYEHHARTHTHQLAIVSAAVTFKNRWKPSLGSVVAGIVGLNACARDNV